ncbi:hypothetical protein J1614_004332 [Plenodomus biglobosus]|nr:hypothetical protein J1614_004332 [Plenodomus biglobosus]
MDHSVCLVVLPKRNVHVAGFFHARRPEKGDTGGGGDGEPSIPCKQGPHARHRSKWERDVLYLKGKGDGDVGGDGIRNSLV